MEFRILGPVEVQGTSGQARLQGVKQVTLLLNLLLQANRVVSVEQLAEAVLGQDPPAEAITAVRTQVYRLRRALDAVEPGGGERIVTRGSMYLFRVEPGELDLDVFRQHVERGRAAAEDERHEEAARELRAGLELWRSATQIASLEEERLAAIGDRIDAELAVGRHTELISELTALTDAHPLRERLRGQLMLALYRTGRQADALQAFTDARRILADELGIDPGPDLQRLNQRILVGDETLAPPKTARSSRRHYLPRDIEDFTGRSEELDQLVASLLADDPSRTAVVITAIDGMAGIGKTVLAVHTAHRLANRFPDAQLFIDMHAHAAGHEPADPTDALHSLLRGLGVPDEQIPDSLDERAAMWRAELADRKALVILDNVAGAAQVRPLLPGTGGSLVLLTSRRRLALEAVHTISLDVLPPGDAIALFERVVGDSRPVADLDAVREVVDLCGYLPLAIRITAARLRTRPAWTIRYLADRLRRDRRRLIELTAGDHSVTAAFELSFRYLTPPQQRLFRLLGLLPGSDFDAYIAAALAGTGLDEAEDMLEELVDAHLLLQSTPDRYRFHDLLRQHARLKADQAEPEAARREALTRVLDYYLDATSRAADHMDTGFQPVEFDGTRPPVHGPPLGTYDDAIAWLDAEQTNLIAAIDYAAENGWQDHAWQLPQALYACSHTRGLTVDWIDAHKLALTATRDHIDQHTRAATLRNLGLSYWQTGQYADALVEFKQSLALYQRLEDRKREGHMLNIVGATYRQLRQYDEAIEHHKRAVGVSEEAGDPWSVGHGLDNLGNVYRLLGRYDEAVEHHLRALAIMRDVGSRRGENDLLNDTGETYCAAGRMSEALDCHQQALEIAHQTYDRYQEARAYDGMAHALRDSDPTTARDYWRRALEIYTDLGVSEAKERAFDV